jgi:sigma-E factor negative regulatory protein RseB
MRADIAIKLFAGTLIMASAPLLFGLAYAEPGVTLSVEISLPAESYQSTEGSLLSPTWWLKKMGGALRSENYAGNFTYIRGSRFDNVRIVHVVEQGKELERLFNLNGEVRELYREDGEAHCYHSRSDLSADGLTGHDVHIGPFTPAFSDRVLSTQNLYNLAMQGKDRVAGRAAVVLTVSPRFNDRYGYRVWLDEETGLLLQSHLIERGRIKEIFQFTHIEVGEFISKSSLQTRMVGDTISHPLALDVNEKKENPVWKVNWLPDGFKPVRIQSNRLHFTDGLATFSVFIETTGPTPMPDLTTTDGGTVVITRRHQKTGPQITVVGEVPVRTARRVAESVEPVLY